MGKIDVVTNTRGGWAGEPADRWRAPAASLPAASARKGAVGAAPPPRLAHSPHRVAPCPPHGFGDAARGPPAACARRWAEPSGPGGLLPTAGCCQAASKMAAGPRRRGQAERGLGHPRAAILRGWQPGVARLELK